MLLKLDEYYSIIQSHVFANKPLTLMRKQLHRAYISELIETINAMQKPKFQSFSSEIESRISGEKLWFSFNTEAQISAEKQLTKLQNQIKIKSFNLTTEEEADHYNNLLKQINAFLNRKTVKPVK